MELVIVPFSGVSARQAITKMLIKAEFSFRHVDGEGFREFMLAVCPKWTKIPRRIIVASNCHNLFLIEKKRFETSSQEKRGCLTTDT